MTIFLLELQSVGYSKSYFKPKLALTSVAVFNLQAETEPRRHLEFLYIIMRALAYNRTWNSLLT